MNKKLFGLTVLLAALVSQGIAALDMTVSGLLDSKATAIAGAGEAEDFSYGIEEYANIRLQSKIRDSAVFYGAFNLVAASGVSALPLLSPAGLALGAGGENYAAARELERLYFRVNGEYTDFDAGLMRLAFGYGQVFGPSDFLNPRNPLFPDARPRGILGAALSVYPADDFKLQGFASAPKDPFNSNGKGILAGLMLENHWSKASLQGFYSYEAPRNSISAQDETGADMIVRAETPLGLHRFSLSAKADLELGFASDIIYTLNPDDPYAIEGLSASAGFDYSFFDGYFYVLAEYLYNGDNSVTANNLIDNIYGFSNHHYLYGLIRYSFNDYTSVSASAMAGLSDLSFMPILTVEHELFQGCALTVNGQIPLDRDLFGDEGNQGEFGPVNSGAQFILTAKVRLRF
jgi:hypothetical protein